MSAVLSRRAGNPRQKGWVAAVNPRRIVAAADHRWHHRRWHPFFDAGLPDIVQTYVYLFGTWEPDLTAFMRRRLRLGDTFIDVGASIGYLSALASRLVGPHGVVVAIEPAPIASAALQETVAVNDLTNIRLVAAAAWDRDGELPLFVGRRATKSGATTRVARSRRTLGRRLGLREQGRVRAAPLGSLVTARSWRQRA